MTERFVNWKYPYFDENGYAWESTTSPFSEGSQQGDRCYGWRCDWNSFLKLGKNVDIGAFSYLQAQEGIEIENNTQIGSSCSIYSVNTENNTKGKIIIGESSLIGSHSLILPNTIIPPNSKIPAYSIVVGNKVYKTERKEYELF